MDLPKLSERLPTLACNALLVGHAQKADLVWSRDEFLAFCEHFLNGNPPDHFLMVYRHTETGQPRYAKAGPRQRADRRAGWAYDSICERAKIPTGIGFYPSNAKKESRWGAMDFDAHDGDHERARRLALSAFQILLRHPELFLVLSTSGSEGWHLFVLTHDFHSCDEWVRLLKQVVDWQGEKIEPGRIEIFPNETTSRQKIGNGIRFPGTFHPKLGTFGGIVFENVAPLLRVAKRNYSVSLYRETHGAKMIEFPDSKLGGLWRGRSNAWRDRFAIHTVSTRRQQLKALLGEVFQQVGREVAQRNWELQFAEKTVVTNASLADHLREAEEIWTWLESQWSAELDGDERRLYDALVTNHERDCFRIVRGFARFAAKKGEPDFPFSREHIAKCLAITGPGAAKIREKFSRLGIIKRTADYLPNKAAARFRWTASDVNGEQSP